MSSRKSNYSKELEDALTKQFTETKLNLSSMNFKIKLVKK